MGEGRRGWVRAGRPALKLLWRIADNPFVQRSAIITGLTLALSAGTLAGIGEWASGTFDSGAESESSSGASEYAGPYAGGLASPLARLNPEPLKFAAVIPAGYTIRRTVPEVRLQFTVSDEQGRPLPDLSQSEIRVLDNQTPVERLNGFARDENLPLRLGIVIDTSDSVKRILPEEKTSALNFLNRVMRPQGDRAFVMGFGADFRIWQTSTTDRAQLIEAVDRLHQPGWGTRFYDAVYSACNEHLSHSEDSNLVHRALVVLSDGEDTQSFRDLRDVVAIAQRGEIQIYTLTLRGNKQVSRSDWLLQRLAEETGGRFFVAQSSKELEGAFAQIEEDLRSQYYVSFPPREDTPGFHALRVEVLPHSRCRSMPAGATMRRRSEPTTLWDRCRSE